KWTENIGGITSYILCGLLVSAAALVLMQRGSTTEMHLAPEWNWDTLRLFGSVAFNLSGMELLGMMGAEIRDPARTVRPAAIGGTLFITVFYTASTLALLVLMRPETVS